MSLSPRRDELAFGVSGIGASGIGVSGIGASGIGASESVRRNRADSN